MPSKKYIPFSEQDRLMASKVDLVSFLQLRGEKLERVGKEHKLIYTNSTGKHDSITVCSNRWYDHKNQIGGGPVKFLREHYGMSYQEAMLELLGGEKVTAIEIISAQDKDMVQPKKEFKLPDANDDMRRVFAYLTKQRFIAPDVISFFARQRKIYEDRDHHNAVFVGTDENGIPKQASLRSTISFGNAFRITVSGSDTKYSFSHFGESGKLFVFEAPIDMLSFITLYQQDWKQHSYIAMNGVYENAVLEALKCHSNLDKVVLCTDNDVGGIDAADRLRDILRENGYANIFRIMPRNKDFNEDLKELHGLTPIPAAAHLRKELFSESVSQLKFTPINLNRAADSLNVALSRNKYTDISNIALSASAEILAKVNEKSAEDMFENLQKHLRKEYRAYTDRGKMFSKMDTLKKSHFEVIKNLRNYPATKEQMKCIAKSLFDLADSALKCSTEQKMSDQQEQEEASQGKLEYKAKAEKFAKITAKTIISADGDVSSMGQNAYFYESAEGLLTSVILLVAEFCPPEKRHIISVFKLIQDLLAPSEVKGKSQFKLLMDKLPSEHKARWFSGAALNSSEQAMASVMTTAMSRLNAFLDTELEQVLCFDTSIDVEDFCNHKSAIYLVLPEEDATKHFLVSLILQQIYREMLTVADEKGGQLDKRVMIYADEIGTLPKIEGLEMMFSASRSRKISIVAIIQSLAQFEKTYGKEGAEIIVDNCQCTLFGAFAPNSKTAEVMSQNLGKQTVLSGSISKSSGRDGSSRSLQMIERSLMTVDELKSMPKGHFVVMKTGCHPMKTRLKLFFRWGIKFEDAYSVAEQAERKVQYADRAELEMEMLRKFPQMAVPVEFEDSFDEAISKKCTPKTRKRTVSQKKDS